MKRRLILMRHAKSDWSQNLEDHERPLNPRGRRDAPRIARALVDAGWLPDLVLCSTAARTTETWNLMEGAFANPPRRVRIRSLYLGSLGDIQNAIESEAEDATETILVLGHNPGWEHAASAFAGYTITMTTANAVLLELESGSWEHAVTSPAREVAGVLRPRELPDA